MLLLSRNTPYIIFDSDIYHNYRAEDNTCLHFTAYRLKRNTAHRQAMLYVNSVIVCAR